MAVLIESLAADAYLADPLEEIAASLLGPEADADARDDLLSRLRCALHWLQRLDPPGVGARSLAECLTLQLRMQHESDARRLAEAVCAGHLDLLARRDFKRQAAATGADEALLRQAQALIVACEPRPGRPFGDVQSSVVVPDVIQGN